MLALIWITEKFNPSLFYSRPFLMYIIQNLSIVSKIQIEKKSNINNKVSKSPVRDSNESWQCYLSACFLAFLDRQQPKGENPLAVLVIKSTENSLQKCSLVPYFNCLFFILSLFLILIQPDFIHSPQFPKLQSSELGSLSSPTFQHLIHLILII